MLLSSRSKCSFFSVFLLACVWPSRLSLVSPHSGSQLCTWLMRPRNTLLYWLVLIFQGLTNFSHQGSESKYFRFCGPQQHRVWLVSIKPYLQNGREGLDWAHKSPLASPCSIGNLTKSWSYLSPQLLICRNNTELSRHVKTPGRSIPHLPARAGVSNSWWGSGPRDPASQSFLNSVLVSQHYLPPLMQCINLTNLL